MRAALLRSAGFDWKCVFSARHRDEDSQGSFQECPSDDKKGGGHVYNVVYYRGDFRLMDYGQMGSYANYKDCWNQHSTKSLFNDHYGEYSDNSNKTPFGNRLLMNYPGTSTCPTATWNWRTYYEDVCN